MAQKHYLRVTDEHFAKAAQLQAAASVTGVNVTGNNMTGFDLTNTNLSNADLRGTNITAGDLLLPVFSNTLLGDQTRFDGFNYTGSVDLNGESIVLYSLGYANLGVITTLTNGSITAANGVALGVGDNIVGSGVVAGRIAAVMGSTIAASGDMTLGDSGRVDGFFSDGQLITNTHTVAINDANVAVLGSLTHLGDDTDGGTLVAGDAATTDTFAHLFVEEGKNITGRGNIRGNFKNNGAAIGDGVSVNERLTFDAPWIVSGKGTFENTLVLGTFAPGERPAIINGTNQGFGSGSTVEIELGGTTPGFGDDNHDQINDSGTLSLFDPVTLSILPSNNFVPSVGDEFVVMTWQTELQGTFANVLVDPVFNSNNIAFDLIANNIGSAGSLTLQATVVPEPTTLLLALIGLALLPHRRRR